MAQFSRVSFDDARDGGRGCLSPNSCLLAYVERGTSIAVDNVAGTFYDNDAAAPFGGAADHEYRRVGLYVALDEVTDIVWSPDSSCIAAWMAPRGTVELISVPAMTPVARIDGGLNGMRQLAWHPSSRCLYWFGLAETYAVSLTDATTMAFENVVKVAPRTSYSSWAMRDRALVVAANGSGRSSAASTVREAAALLAFSRDSAYIFTVSPCSVISDAATSPADESGAVGSGGEAMEPAEYQRLLATEVQRIDAAAVDESLAVSFETFRVFDSVTHDNLAGFPIDMTLPRDKDRPPVAGSVSSFRVTSSCVLFFDRPNMHVLLLSLDGKRRLGDYHNITAFDVGHDGSMILLLDLAANALVAIACVFGRTHRMPDIPLTPSYFHPGTPVLTEEINRDTHAQSGAGHATTPRSTYVLATTDEVYRTYSAFTAEALALRDVQTVFAQAYETVAQRHNAGAVSDAKARGGAGTGPRPCHYSQCCYRHRPVLAP
jgi:hypothetical protein